MRPWPLCLNHHWKLWYFYFVWMVIGNCDIKVSLCWIILNGTPDEYFLRFFFKGKKCSNAWGEFWASMCCKFRTYNLNGSFHPIHLSSVFSSLKLYHSLLHRREEADELEQLKYWTRDFLSPFEVLQTSVTRLDKWLAGFHTVALQISRFTLRQINEERVAQNSPFNLLMLSLWLNLRVLLKLRYWLLPMVQFECCWNSGHLGLVIWFRKELVTLSFMWTF